MDPWTIFAVVILALIGGIVLFVLYSRRQHQRDIQAITIRRSIGDGGCGE